MNPFLRGMKSLISPIERPPHKSKEEIEKLAWQMVGDCLYQALDEYGKTEEYKKALTNKA